MTKGEGMQYASREWGVISSALAVLVVAACGHSSPQASAGDGPSVVARTDVARVGDCPAGGSVVSTGFDENGDGVLQDAEVMNRSLVCNSGPAVVTRLVSEPPGVNCRTGGTNVLSGLDQNGNGVLDDAEIARSDFACGQTLLTRLAVEPAGARCGVGGVVFLAGRDGNDDGVLEDAEVETQSLECGDTVSRDVMIASDTDVAALAEVKVITGAVVANLAFGVHMIALPKLEHVGHGFEIVDTRNPPATTPLPKVSLPRLQEVDQELGVRAGVSEIDCPQLRRVGSLVLFGTGLADVRGFPALTMVDHDVVIQSNPVLTAADLPLDVIAGDVSIRGNDRLAGLHWKLRARVGDVSVSDNLKLTALSFAIARDDGAALQAGKISIELNDALTQVAVSADHLSSLDIKSNAQIADVAIDVAGADDLTLFDLPTPFHLGLTSAGADHIAIDGTLEISGALQSFESTAPIVCGGCGFDHTLLTRLDPGHAMTVGGLGLSNNSQLTSIAPLRLTGSAGLDLSENPLLQSIDFVTLEDHQIGSVTLSHNASLVDAPSLLDVIEVHGSVDVDHNPVLTSLFGPSLQRVDGISIQGNASLLVLRYPLLENQQDHVLVEDNAALQVLDLPALSRVNGQLLIEENPQLHHIAFDTLGFAGMFDVSENPALPTCEVSAIFARVSGITKSQSGNDDSATCGP